MGRDGLKFSVKRGCFVWLNPDLTTTAAAAYTTPAKIITTRPREERMSLSFKCGLAHTSQDSASTKPTVLQSTAEVATLRLHHGYAGISTVTLLLRESFGGKDSWLYGKRKGHRSPFHRCFSKYLFTSRASGLLVETPSYPKGKNIYIYIYI